MLLSARMRKTEWTIQPPDRRADSLAQSLRIAPLVAQVLLNRGVTDAKQGNAFLRPKLTMLIPPRQMPGIGPAVARLKQAIETNEKITIYGDYDVDGITGLAILWRLLTMLGAQVDYYIPHRIDEGYGLNAGAVRSLAEAGTNLLVTVDCGIGAIESALLAEQLGVDLIITDHHPPDPELPKAAAIVHPALDPAYPNQDSAGAMVAFKLAWALADELSGGPRLDAPLRQFMLNATALASMGTVADVVDLRGENRVLASYGLKSLPHCDLSGIMALIESAQLTGRGLDSYDVGFKLAPMLNAAGRMGHARLAVELLASDNPARCVQIAEYLKDQNTQRQQLERRILKQACEMIAHRGLNHPDRKSIVLAADNWHAGVLGIVASRIVDRFYRPAILLNASPNDDGLAHGSGRSIPGFCLLAAIRTCSQHLSTFGGHKMAAGLTMPPDNIGRFAQALEDYASQNLSDQDIVARLTIDAAPPLNQLSFEAVSQLQLLGPFGQGNPTPIFATNGVRLLSPPRRVGAKGDHLQLAVTDGKASIRCVAFGMGSYEKKLLERDFFNIAYEANINTYNGNSNVQLVLRDIQFD